MPPPGTRQTRCKVPSVPNGASRRATRPEASATGSARRTSAPEARASRALAGPCLLEHERRPRTAPPNASQATSHSPPEVLRRLPPPRGNPANNTRSMTPAPHPALGPHHRRAHLLVARATGTTPVPPGQRNVPAPPAHPQNLQRAASRPEARAAWHTRHASKPPYAVGGAGGAAAHEQTIRSPRA